MFRLIQKYFFFLIIAITNYSCEEKSIIKRPDVSSIDVNVKIDRFDQEFKSLKSGDILKSNTKWQQDYPFFYTDYMVEMLEVGDPKDSLYVESVLSKVIQKKDFIDLNAAVNKVFPNLKKQEEELTKAFKYIKYYFPAYQVPKVIAFVGGFSFQTPIGEDYLGIGLDMFLGADSEFYPALVKSIPLYISRRFTPENITPRVIESVLRQEILPEPNAISNTLQYMIYNGKIMYALDVILENVDDTLKIGYTQKQMDWARHYQKDIWAWFLSENLLYSTDYIRVQKYFSEAPFTRELGSNNESAPKLGSYIGWMIVRTYMERNPNVSLDELLLKDDAQEILEGAKFKG